MTNINNGDCRFLNYSSLSVVKFFLNLFYIRLPRNVSVFFRHLFINQAHVSKLRINAVNHFYYIKSTIISVNNYLSSTNIIWSCGYQNHRLFPIDDDFQSRVRQRWLSLWEFNVSLSYFLRTREGYMSTITKSGLITAGTFSIKQHWVRLPLIGIKRDSAIIDLAYLIAGLVAITQSRLVHRVLQRMEHTDLTGWSNSHLLHWRQIHAWLFDE